MIDHTWPILHQVRLVPRCPIILCNGLFLLCIAPDLLQGHTYPRVFQFAGYHAVLPYTYTRLCLF